jgi:ribosomal protein S18 acetylase RimI-like enzyme
MNDDAPAAAPTIRPFRKSDAGLMVSHFVRQTRESGQRGLPHFAPRLEVDHDEVRSALERRLATPLDEPDWGRAFVLVVPEEEVPPTSSPTSSGARFGERIVGHVDMRGGRLRSEMHRATLGLGIERAYHRRGLGRALCERAIAFARDEAHVTWVDLHVFEPNAPARALYRGLGFEERGNYEDAFRLPDGVIVGDIHMVLRLR